MARRNVSFNEVVAESYQYNDVMICKNRVGGWIFQDAGTGQGADMTKSPKGGWMGRDTSGNTYRGPKGRVADWCLSAAVDGPMFEDGGRDCSSLVKGVDYV